MSFLENIIGDVSGAVADVVGLSLMLAKQMRITSSKLECKIAIHGYLKSGGDTTDVERYFKDCSPCGQEKILDKLKCASVAVQKEIDCVQHKIDEKQSSCFPMFSSRRTKTERLSDLNDLKNRIDTLKITLEQSLGNKITARAV